VRVPITAKVVANMLTSVGVDRVLTVDLHADQIQGFFECPVDNVYASPILMGDIWKQKYPDMIVVSPDVGGVVRARAIAKQLNIIGEVKGKTCIIVDDMVDTAGTLCQAAGALKKHGAKGVYAYCTHPVLSGKAIENIENSALDEMVVTDTIPLSQEAQHCTGIRQVSVAGMLAETIRRIHYEESVSSLYMD
jgi:ribose-phosphate pyrophosphokinase